MITSLFEEGKRVLWLENDRLMRLDCYLRELLEIRDVLCSQVQRLKHLKWQVNLLNMILIERNYLRECMKLNGELLHLQGYIYQNFKMDENGAAFVKIDKATLEQV